MQSFRSTMFTLFLASVAIPALPPAASAQIVIGIEVPPPPLPIYDQPPIPAPGYVWTPGYWAYDDDYGYYWVPGTWVLAPQIGLLWTPGYWGFEDGRYVYYDGYWGPEVGFYGGVDYGYGYTGNGYEGGHWQGVTFFYNRAVNNFANVNIPNVYSKPVVAPTTVDGVSYNGGAGGTNARPTEQQQAFAHEHHVPPTAVQRQHIQLASHDPSLRETENKGRPPIAATSRPQDFKGPGVIAAKTAGERPHGQFIPQGTKGPAQPHGVAPPRNATGQERPLGKPNPKMQPGIPNAPALQPHPQAQPHPAMQPHPEGMPNPQAEPQPAMQPHPVMQPRPEAQPHPAMQPHPQAPPHPQGQPHPQQMMQRPAGPPHPEGRPQPAAGGGPRPGEHKQPQGQP